MQKDNDVIYRQQAINKMRKLQRWIVVKGYNKNEGLLYDDVMFLLDKLPPARVERIERKKGQWIPDDCDYERLYRCSECKLPFRVETFMMKPSWWFCPNCGADMRGDEE